MSERNRPTSRPTPSGDGTSGDDFPLTSIPSVPEDALVEPDGVAWAVTSSPALVCSSSSSPSPCSTLPEDAGLAGGRELAPAEDRPVAAAPEAEVAAPRAAEPAAPAPRTAEAAPTDLRRDLELRSQRLAELERSLGRSASMRRAAERKLEEAQRTAREARAEAAKAAKAGGDPGRGGPAGPSPRPGARIAELDKQVAALQKELGLARNAAGARDQEKTDLRAQLEAAEGRARKAEAAQSEERKNHARRRERRGAQAGLRPDRGAAQRRGREGGPDRGRAPRSRSRPRWPSLRQTAAAAPPATRRPVEPAASREERPVERPPAAAAVREPQRLRTPPPRYPEELRQ